MESPFQFVLIIGFCYYFSVLPPLSSPVGNGRSRDCIALGVYSYSHTIMDSACVPSGRGIFFRAIPQSLKMLHY